MPPEPSPASADPVALLPPLREVIAQHGLAAHKSLGQHFLLDLNLTRRIAREAGELTAGTVIEIGPGPGGLTRALLLEGAANLVAVERDQRCMTALTDLAVAASGRLTLIEADARTVDAAALGRPPRRIVANLPYNVGTHLLLGWLARAEAFASMTLMFQKEVADRLVAAPGSRSYGRLSVAAGWRCRVRRLFDIPARAFTPPPKIDSTVIEFIPYAAPPWPADPGDFERVTAAAFGQRRKMLRGALKALPIDAEALLHKAGIAPTARAEELDIPDFARLARAFTDLRAGT